MADVFVIQVAASYGIVLRKGDVLDGALADRVTERFRDDVPVSFYGDYAREVPAALHDVESVAISLVLRTGYVVQFRI